MIASMGVFALLDTTAKYLSHWYPVPAIVWARYAGNLVLIVALLGARGQWRLMRSARPGTQFLRGLLLSLATLFYFSSLKVLPMAVAASIGFVLPLFVVVLAVPLLGERLDTPRLAAVVVGLAGALVVVRPGSALFTWFALLPMAMALSNALYQILTRKVAGVEPAATSLFWGAVVGTVIFAPLLAFDWRWPQTAWHWALFCAMGVFGLVGHLALIRGLERAPASLLASFVYSQLVWVMLLGYFVFGNFPDGWSLFGMAIIVGAGLYLANRQRLVTRG